MTPSYGLLRSRVTCQPPRFETSSMITESVYECIFSERGTLRDVRSTRHVGQSGMRAIMKYMVLPQNIRSDLMSYQGELMLVGFYLSLCLTI